MQFELVLRDLQGKKLNEPNKDEINLSHRFPDLKPVSSSPTLFSINGIGFGLNGSRDRDEQTQTYIATWCVIVFFIPVLPLKAYRVARAEGGGWYFIGREPLSAFAKTWNTFFLFATVALIVFSIWAGITGSPDYVARQDISKAEQKISAGEIGPAAFLLKSAAVRATQPDVQRQATSRFEELFQKEAQQADLEEVAALLRVHQSLQKQQMLSEMNIVDWLCKYLSTNNNLDSKQAFELLEEFLQFGETSEEIVATQSRLLESIVKQHPDDLETLARLAEIYFNQKNLEKCKSLLLPVAEKLEGTRGAKLLGGILFQEGNTEQAKDLLKQYVDRNLPRFEAALDNYGAVQQRVEKEVYDSLNAGEGSPEFYSKWEKANESQKNILLQELVAEAIREDSELLEAEKELQNTGDVVAVTLDLGVIYLREGQSATDAAQKRRMFEAAENTFLSIRKAVGESDEYRLYLGQVYYWLGKEKQGEQLFAELLAKNGRDFSSLISVANTFRSVGLSSKSKKLVEEAYESTSNQQEKFMAASLRAADAFDYDERIKWLSLTDPSQPSTLAALASAKGGKAMANGDFTLAEKRYLEAIDYYENIPENETTLNNAALVYTNLFDVTYDRQYLDESIRRMEQAVSLSPAGTILLHNTASLLVSRACLETMGDAIDFEESDSKPSFDLVKFLIRSNNDRTEICSKFRKCRDLDKAVELLLRAQTLAPKRATVYGSLSDIYIWTENYDALNQLAQLADSNEIDWQDSKEYISKYLSGSMDERFREQSKSALSRKLERLRQRPNDSSVNFALLCSAANYSNDTLAILGGNVDRKKQFQFGELAFRRSPSVATSEQYVFAHLRRCYDSLSSDAQFRTHSERLDRSLHVSNLIAMALLDSGLRPKILANQHFRSAMKNLESHFERFPAESRVVYWALLRWSNSDLAEQVKTNLLKCPYRELAYKIDWLVEPCSVTSAVDYYNWLLVSNDAQPEKAFAKLKELSLPFPMVSTQSGDDVSRYAGILRF